MYPYPPCTCTATSQARLAFSLPKTLAIEPARVNGLPASFRAAAFDEEGTDSARARLAGSRPDDDDARMVARGDPLLAAVDHVLVPVAARGRPQRARVRAGVRLGETEARRREAPGGDLRDVSLL